jgi:hypothetical protein
MGPITSSPDACERGGHSLPGRSAVEPKGGVPDIPKSTGAGCSLCEIGFGLLVGNKG